MKSLRIAFSAVCIVGVVLILALWIRSYFAADVLRWNGSGRVSVTSARGGIRISSSSVSFAGVPRWERDSTPIESMMPDGLRLWHSRFDQNGMFLAFPHRLLIVIFVLFAALPWIRFGVRTLLISVAVICVLLALAIY